MGQQLTQHHPKSQKQSHELELALKIHLHYSSQETTLQNIQPGPRGDKEPPLPGPVPVPGLGCWWDPRCRVLFTEGMLLPALVADPAPIASTRSKGKLKRLQPSHSRRTPRGSRGWQRLVPPALTFIFH